MQVLLDCNKYVDFFAVRIGNALFDNGVVSASYVDSFRHRPKTFIFRQSSVVVTLY